MIARPILWVTRSARSTALGLSVLVATACGTTQSSEAVVTSPALLVPSAPASAASEPTSSAPVSVSPTSAASPGLQVPQMVDIGGRSLYVSCVGESAPGEPTIVFENGLGSTASDWWSIQQAVSATVRACIYDRAGMGSSDPAGSELRTVQDLADDLEALLAKAGIQAPYVFVSHSLGPWVTTLFTVAHPESVVGLVFVDPRGPDVSAGWLAGLPPPTTGETEALTVKRDLMTALEDEPSANPEGLAMRASEVEMRAALGSAEPPFGDIPVIVLQAALTPDYWADLPEPARSAWDHAWLGGQAALAAASTAGRVDVLPGATHNVQGTAPSSIIDVIHEILATIG